MQRIAERLLERNALVAGVLSGTSGDGIDVALTSFPEATAQSVGAPKLRAFATLPFPESVRERVRRVLDGEPQGLRESALLSRDLGRAFGAAASAVAKEHGLALDLVASHGQTVWHHDGVEASGPATSQLGDGDFVAEESGCAVVSDFRQRDIAAGGEGAPISALADDAIFAAVPRPCAILNLGGLANLTILCADGATLSFDTGPANSLLDGLARRLLGRPYDEDGAAAAKGTSNERWIAELLAHPFLQRPPPKSTGRDTFGEAYVSEVIERARALGVLRDHEGAHDLLASAADFVARSVVDGLDRFGGKVQWLVLCGGGAHHARLVDSLAVRARAPVASSLDFGVDPDAREALVFAVLGARCVLGHPVTSPSATGARAGRILGKFSAAPCR
ncbi:MAG TPA: anhydro-N-acetylmuramic acid kinase [Planctomycetota bacterium]|nr:anhydro-N-acetylmuramic acid kinase [Planctomycetota bacterium]